MHSMEHFSRTRICSEEQLRWALGLGTEYIRNLGKSFDRWTESFPGARDRLDAIAADPKAGIPLKSQAMFLLSCIGDNRAVDLLHGIATNPAEDYHDQRDSSGWIACIPGNYAIQRLDSLIRTHGTWGVEEYAVNALLNWSEAPSKLAVIKALKTDRSRLSQMVRDVLDGIVITECSRPELN